MLKKHRRALSIKPFKLRRHFCFSKLVKKQLTFLASLPIILANCFQPSEIFHSIKIKEFTLANIISAKKRARQSEARRKHNASIRSNMRTFIKKVIAAIRSGNKEEASQAFQVAQPIIDRTAGKGIIHKNKAARTKSRLSARIKAMLQPSA